MNGTAVEPGAKPSAHGRSAIFPAMNRLFTREGNVHSDGAQPRDGTAPASFAPEPPLFFSVFSTPSCSYPAVGPKRWKWEMGTFLVFVLVVNGGARKSGMSPFPLPFPLQGGPAGLTWRYPAAPPLLAAQESKAMARAAIKRATNPSWSPADG